MTIKDLIRQSMLLIGAIGQNEVPTSSEASDALSLLLGIMEAWNIEHNLAYSTVRNEHPLTVGLETYSIGETGALLTQPRPNVLEKAGLIIAGTPSYELPVKVIDVAQYANIVVKTITSSYPTAVYLENAVPNSILHLWPVPSVPSRLVLYSWSALAIDSVLDTVLVLPPGYRRALTYNLALEMASMYGTMPSEVVIRVAMDAKASIKNVNSRAVVLDTDSALLHGSGGGRFNWRLG